MFEKRKIYKILVGVLAVILALCVGRRFGVNFTFSLGNILSLFFVLAWLYILIGLLRLRSWAWAMLLTIIFSIILIMAPFIIIDGLEVDKEALLESLLYMFFWVSLLVISVFGISALVRKIIKKRQDKSDGFR